MMGRQHGASLWESAYYSNERRNTTSKINDTNDHNDSSSSTRSTITESLKAIGDKVTFKDWRNGITGSVQFSAKFISQENCSGGEEGILESGNNSHYEYIHTESIGKSQHTIHHDVVKEERAMSSSTPKNNEENRKTACDGHTAFAIGGNDMKAKSMTIYSKTGNFLCIDIEKCIDLRFSAASFITRRQFFRRFNKSSSALFCPFILIKLNNEEVGRTPTLKYTNNPIWYDEIFQLPICTKCTDITLEVWEEINTSGIGGKQTRDRTIGDFIGKCTFDIQSFIKQYSKNSGDFVDVTKEIHRWPYNEIDPMEDKRCSCPWHDSFSSASMLGNVNQRRETVRVQAAGNSFRRKRQRLPSILVEKPKNHQSNQRYDQFKIKNTEPFRRKDIREMKSEDQTESFMNSPYTKALLLMTIYLVVGVVGFSFTFEHWSIRDSVYFSVVTFSTVGYGDIRPASDGAKLFSCVFALMGIGIIGIALGFIGQNLVHAQIAALQRSQRNKDDNVTDGCLQSLPLLRNVLLFICPIAVMTMFGSIVVGAYEKWNWVDSIYWCVMTGTSVGYGDFVPRTNGMIWFSVFFIPLSVGCISAALGKIANIFVEQEIAKANSKLLKREVTLEDLEMMNADGDGEVSPLEFIEHMLKVMHKVDQNLLDELHAQFEKLDADGSGGLQQDDLELLTERKLKERRQQAIERYERSLLNKNRRQSDIRRLSKAKIVPDD
jgi:hypothetical protein